MIRSSIKTYLAVLAAFSIVISIVPRVGAQGGNPSGLPQEKIDEIDRHLKDGSNGSVDDGIRGLEDSRAVLAPYSGENANLKAIRDLFGLERDRRAVYGNDFRESINSIGGAETPEARRAAMTNATLELARPAADLMQMAASDGVDVEEARRFLEVAKVISQAVDDLVDRNGFGERGSFEGAKSALQKFLTIASGIAELNRGVWDRDANRLLAGFRDTIGQLILKLKGLGVDAINPLAMFEYPAALTAAQMQVVNEGFQRVTDAVRIIGELIANDTPEGRQRLLRMVERIEETLSPDNFARSLIVSAIDRTVDRLPFVRTFRAMIGPGGLNVCQLKKIGEQHKLGRYEPTAKVNCRLYDALGNELVGTSFDRVKLVSPHPLARGKRNLTHTYNGCGEIWGGTWNFSFSREQRFGIYPAINCGDLKLDPYFSYELIVSGERYGRLILARSPGDNDDVEIPFDLIDSSGNEVALLITDYSKHETYFDVAPGVYRVRYNSTHSRYNNDRLGIAIRSADFEKVEIRPGKITRLTMPLIRYD
ncbi:MAG: hypothetical protein J5I65_04645 [Aridibacter famidurans]|nr:hypothetical protein [Aridibacter famidurans]